MKFVGQVFQCPPHEELHPVFPSGQIQIAQQALEGRGLAVFLHRGALRHRGVRIAPAAAHLQLPIVEKLPQLEENAALPLRRDHFRREGIQDLYIVNARIDELLPDEEGPAHIAHIGQRERIHGKHILLRERGSPRPTFCAICFFRN